MNRRAKARQKKRKERERRLRQQKHAAHSGPAEAPTDEDEPLEAGLEPTEDDEADDEGSEPALFFHLEERLLRRVARILARHEDADAAERERVAAAIKGKSPEELDAEFGEDPVERAQDLAFLARDGFDDDEGAPDDLLDEALALDPACTDALVLRAMQTRRERVRFEQLAQVIADAEATLGGAAALPRDGSLWANVHARPYLRARHMRLALLADAGRTAEAIAEGNALLELDATDHLNARAVLGGALLEAGELAAAGALIERFDAEPSLCLAWAQVLERFLAGDRRRAAMCRRALTRILPEVEELILGQRRDWRPGDPRATPVDEMASDIYGPVARAWARHREARRWLADGAPETTAAERRAAPKSYGPPVAELLRLGEPILGGPGTDDSRWPDYSGDHDLHADDIPELLRMAADPALHEQDPTRDAVWAPVHAWRALAQFAAAGVESAQAVTDAIFLRLEIAPDDDWTVNDAEHVMALVGEPVLDELTELLANGMAQPALRSTAAGCLAAISVRHPRLRGPVLKTLCETLRDRVEHAEGILAEGYVVEDEIEEEEIDMIGLVVCGLMELAGGTGEGGDERLALAKRAHAAGILNERICGTMEVVLAEMRGESDGPDT